MSKPTTRPVIASWILIVLAVLASLLPGLGFLMWIIGLPILLVTFILGIVVISKGSTLSGVAILLCSLIVAPAVMVIGPIVTTSATLKAVDDVKREQAQKPVVTKHSSTNSAL